MGARGLQFGETNTPIGASNASENTDSLRPSVATTNPPTSNHGFARSSPSSASAPPMMNTESASRPGASARKRYR